MIKRTLPAVLCLTLFFTTRLFPLATGGRIPEMNLLFLDGTMEPLSKQMGAKGLVISFFSHTCINCPGEIAFIQRYPRGSSGINAILVADMNTIKDQARKYLAQVGKTRGVSITLKTADDAFGDLRTDFGVKAHPTVFVVDRTGKVVYRGEGFSAEKERLLKEALDRLAGKS